MNTANLVEDPARRGGRPSKGVLLASGMLVALVLVLGCRSEPVPQGGPHAYPAASSASDHDYSFFPRSRPVQPPATFDIDANVAEALRQMIREDPALASTSRAVRLKVEKGVVTLRGRVPSESDKERLIEKVQNMTGVDGVRDRLTVSPAQ